MNILPVLLGVAILTSIAVLVFYMVDVIGLSSHDGTGRVLEKKYTATYITHQYNSALKVSLPITTPESWKLYIHIKGRTGSIEVNESTYRRAKIAENYKVRYTKGRITGKIYINDIYDKVEI